MPLAARPVVALGAAAGLIAAVEGLLGGVQRDRYARVGGRVAQDDVGIQVTLSVVGVHTEKQLAHVGAAARAGHLGQVLKHIIADAVAYDDRRGAAAALGHVVHDLAGK